jgi:hypothetical protein
MQSELSIENKAFTYKKRRRTKRHAISRSKRKNTLSLIICVGIITISSFSITYNMYIHSNSKDLGFAVEYSLTNGFSSENKLLRVQKMSLVYFDGETAIIEASGLAKISPHKMTSIKGSYKKDASKSWHLEKIMSSN